MHVRRQRQIGRQAALHLEVMSEGHLYHTAAIDGVPVHGELSVQARWDGGANKKGNS